MANYNFDKITNDELHVLAAIALLPSNKSQVQAARIVMKTAIGKETKKLFSSQQVEFSEKKKELKPIEAAIKQLQTSIIAMPKPQKEAQSGLQLLTEISETPTPE